MKDNKPDISLIRKYLDGELDERAMYQLERQAEADPLLMDVIKGMESADADSHQRNLKSIDRLLQERIERSKPRRILPIVSWQVAASLFIALSVATWLLVRHPEREGVAKRAMPRENKDSIRVSDPVGEENTAVAETKKLERRKPGVSVQPKNSGSAGPLYEEPALIAKLEKFTRKKSGVTAQADVERELKDGLPLAENAANRVDKKPISLEEVSVVAYGTLKKKDLTGAVSSVNSLELQNANPGDSSFNQSVMGKVPGVTVLKGISGSNSKSIITGKVVDKSDGSSLSGALVRVYGTEHTARTGTDGKFSIHIPDSTKALSISMIGYEQKQVEIRKGERVEIKLEPSTATLSEVVVIGYGSEKSNSGKVQPLTGWRAYRNYLKSKAISPDGKTYRVNLEFTVDPSGAISNFVVKGANEAVNRKAIEIIKSGSKWISAKDGRSQTVKLRITFQ